MTMLMSFSGLVVFFFIIPFFIRGSEGSGGFWLGVGREFLRAKAKFKNIYIPHLWQAVWRAGLVFM